MGDWLAERSQFELSGDLRLGVFLESRSEAFQPEALRRFLADQFNASGTGCTRGIEQCVYVTR